MPQSRKRLLEELEYLRLEEGVHRKAIEDTRALLAKADARRKADPAGRRRWDETIDALERTLTTSKGALARVAHEIEERQARVDSAPDDPSETVAPSTQPSNSSPHAEPLPDPPKPPKLGGYSLEAERRKQFAQFRRVLDKCIPEKMGTLALSDVALLVRVIEQMDLPSRPELLDAPARQRLGALRKILRETLARLDNVEGY
jgi:hypothetical protein